MMYLVNSLFDLAETNIQMHLLLLQLTAFLVKQVGVLVDEVKVVAGSNGHGVTATLSQVVISLRELVIIMSKSRSGH